MAKCVAAGRFVQLQFADCPYQEELVQLPEISFEIGYHCAQIHMELDRAGKMLHACIVEDMLTNEAADFSWMEDHEKVQVGSLTQEADSDALGADVSFVDGKAVFLRAHVVSPFFDPRKCAGLEVGQCRDVPGELNTLFNVDKLLKE